jgi:hypothetical protein
LYRAARIRSTLASAVEDAHLFIDEESRHPSEQMCIETMLLAILIAQHGHIRMMHANMIPEDVLSMDVLEPGSINADQAARMRTCRRPHQV